MGGVCGLVARWDGYLFWVFAEAFQVEQVMGVCLLGVCGWVVVLGCWPFLEFKGLS
ncbi:protein of unknown function [Paraburkholderia dioscoreae]|uniref:Uncharacterized protein n=1 Tax=Paraburkholderia dioscoreae TaxID=2604047 RepID=A0A5Q4ZHS3_9BURK|nr:protein of unknown function [Paraburkholderia dioscoreae]